MWRLKWIYNIFKNLWGFVEGNYSNLLTVSVWCYLRTLKTEIQNDDSNVSKMGVRYLQSCMGFCGWKFTPLTDRLCMVLPVYTEDRDVALRVGITRLIGLKVHWPLGNLDVIFENEISMLVLLIGIFRSSYDNAIRWIPRDLTDGKSTLDQAMAWYRQTTSHYMSKCWLRYVAPYGFTRQQWLWKKCERMWKHLNKFLSQVLKRAVLTQMKIES